jgi:hypothetical protein
VRALIWSVFNKPILLHQDVDYDSLTARRKGKLYYRSFVLVLCSPEPRTSIIVRLMESPSPTGFSRLDSAWKSCFG